MASKQAVKRPEEQRADKPKRNQAVRGKKAANLERRPVHSLIIEDGVMRAVMELALLCGWLVFHDEDSRRNPAGFPDLVLVHPNKSPGIIFAELKTAKGKTRAKQEEWLNKLALVMDKIYPAETKREHINVCLWRPQHWPQIEKILTGE